MHDVLQIAIIICICITVYIKVNCFLVGLETIECSFVDSSGCHHFYFVARGQRIEAEKTQGICKHFYNIQKSIIIISIGNSEVVC